MSDRIARVFSWLFALWFIAPNLFATWRAVHSTFWKNIPVEPYQIWWAGVMGSLQLAVAYPVWRARPRIPGSPLLVFAVSSLIFAMAEELTCYLVRTGIFRHLGEVPTPILFAVGTSLLWMCALGGYFVYRTFDLKWYQALLLFAFSGFLLEALPFQKLYRRVPLPILFGILPPVAAWHYVLIGLFPFLLVRDPIESRPRSDHPLKWTLGLVLPLVIPTILVLTALS